jgi:hypothetical protein
MVGLVPHSNQASVARPFGFTVPLKAEEVAVMADAADVVTVGGGGSVEEPPPPPQETSENNRKTRKAGSRNIPFVKGLSLHFRLTDRLITFPLSFNFIFLTTYIVWTCSCSPANQAFPCRL